MSLELVFCGSHGKLGEAAGKTFVPLRVLFIPLLCADNALCHRCGYSLTGGKLAHEAATPDQGPGYWEWLCVPKP